MPAATSPPPRPLPCSAIPFHLQDLSHKIPKLIPRRTVKPTARASSPPPSTPVLPSIPTNIRYQHPTRRILSPQDHALFLESPTYSLVKAFIFQITDSIRSTPISFISFPPQHPTITALLRILSEISTLQQQCPADHTSGSRFGNPAFRTFLSSLTLQIEPWHAQHLQITNSGALDELQTYLSSSFGSGLRIDYGSGHELNFMMYLLCLRQLGHLPESTFPALALIVFPAYLELMRTIQEEYYLEPAGSHGVWGLDDYHFLPFLFGAAQLADADAGDQKPVHKSGAQQGITPLSIHSPATLEAFQHEYLYLSQVSYVNSTKTVQGLRWHSPMLDDISGVKTRDGGWRKIEGGMRKMFVKEVLGKLVVMQHFLFGGIIPAVGGMSVEEDEQVVLRDSEERDVLQEGVASEGEVKRAMGHEGHAHNTDFWGDCCGIKVPSSVGAVGEMRKRGAEGLRRLPFD